MTCLLIYWQGFKINGYISTLTSTLTVNKKLYQKCKIKKFFIYKNVESNALYQN